MTWPFGDGSAFPVRDGFDVGGAQERTMGFSVGGFSGQRVAEEVNPDGSITILRTRLGNPIFETENRGTAAAILPDPAPRGFVAKATATALRFNPYTLSVVNNPYYPAGNLYTVQSFATTWNVDGSDTTHWHDVVIFDGSTIKVNAKSMPDLLITPALSFPAIPYVIAGTPKYGDSSQNATEKRVFAVGRHEVKSWGGGGTSFVLEPITARTNNKAMTIGQRISGTDKATVSQFYFTGTSWDSLAGGWGLSFAEVTMLLASPYLTSVAGSSTVDQPLCVPVATANTSPSSSVAVTLPSTELLAYGSAELGSSVYAPEGVFDMFQWLISPFAGTVSYAVPGFKDTTGTTNNWTGSASASNGIAGRTVNYAASNVLARTAQSETYTHPVINYPLGGDPNGNAGGEYGKYYSSGGGTYEWFTQPLPMFPRTSTVTKTFSRAAGALGVSATYNMSTQTASASAKLGSIELVNVAFSRIKTSGNQVSPTATTGRFAAEIANPYAWCTFGNPAYSDSQAFTVTMHADEPNHANVVGKRQPLILSKASSLIGGQFFANDKHLNDQLYTGTISARPTVDDQALSWNTTDYILYDETNGVYVSLIAYFTATQAYGAAGSGTLLVSWRVKTRFHDTTTQIHSETISYLELLPESVLEFGVNYVKSPRIRAIFAPLFQEQGSFPGAHYVTQAEEGNGAAPFHGFNFSLKLRPYPSISTVNADNATGPDVHFVPVNLLEMLYAYVYSSKYGVDDYARYPVDRTATYNSITTALFTTGFRVAVKNGTQSNWTDVFGGSYASIQTVSLHRV